MEARRRFNYSTTVYEWPWVLLGFHCFTTSSLLRLRTIARPLNQVLDAARRIIASLVQHDANVNESQENDFGGGPTRGLTPRHMALDSGYTRMERTSAQCRAATVQTACPCVFAPLSWHKPKRCGDSEGEGCSRCLVLPGIKQGKRYCTESIRRYITICRVVSLHRRG